jgi:uncharacterized protein YecT (DUF1311 family)
LTKADGSLNKVYALILRELTAGSMSPSEPPYFDDWKTHLVKSERAWVTFKKAQCLVAGELLGPGTGVPIETANCLLDLTNQRFHFLNDYARLVRHYSKLCHPDEVQCAFPDERT